VPYTDKELTCIDCGSGFTFTAGEQEFHASKGFTNEPRRCVSCRRARKGESGGGGAPRADREMFSVPCASCGNEARVPFEPRGDRPIYCSDCFQSQPRTGAGARSSYGGGYGNGGYGGYSDYGGRGGRGGGRGGDRRGGGRRW